MPHVSIILVNWNGLKDTTECLDSLSKVTYSNFTVIVVDNGSLNNDAVILESRYPKVKVIAESKNLGFTGGNNMGIRYALASGADYILCLNNDTIVDAGFLEPLIQALENQPRAGIATSAIYYHDQPERLSTLGCWVDFSKDAPVGHIDASSALRLDLMNATEVAAVDGCVLLMRRAVAEATKGFDPKFFAYVEDADICLRARHLGWKCLAVPSSLVWHKVGSTTGGENSPTATHYYLRNSYRLVLKHGNALERELLKLRFWDLWLTEWEAYLLAGERDGRTWRDPQAVRRLSGLGANVFVSTLRCHGARQSYHVVESAIRLLIVALAKCVTGAAMSVYPKYVKIYWKLHSKTTAFAGQRPARWQESIPMRQTQRRQQIVKLLEKLKS